MEKTGTSASPRAPAGSSCPESQQAELGGAQSASGGTGRARRGSNLKYPKQKNENKNAVNRAAEGCTCVREGVVCLSSPAGS